MHLRLLIIIPAANQTQANQIAHLQLDPIGGHKTFSIGLSPTAKPPITHYWCSISVPEQCSALRSRTGSKLSAIQPHFPDALILQYNADADPSFPHQTIASLLLKPITTLPQPLGIL